VVAYEVFTASTLPRRGLLRYWRRAVILAAGYGALVALGLRLSVQPVHLALIACLLITIFYALLSSRAYQERQHYIDSLRPFISSQDAYASILSLHSPQDIGETPSSAVKRYFQALCRNSGRFSGYLVRRRAISLAGPATAIAEGYGKAGGELSVIASPDIPSLMTALC
jgi:hypothetical protein